MISYTPLTWCFWSDNSPSIERCPGHYMMFRRSSDLCLQDMSSKSTVITKLPLDTASVPRLATVDMRHSLKKL